MFVCEVCCYRTQKICLDMMGFLLTNGQPKYLLLLNDSQGVETLDEVDYRIMLSGSSVDNDTFDDKSCHWIHGTDERFSGVTVGGVGGGESSLRTSTSPDGTTRGVPQNVSSESIRCDLDEASDRLQCYTRRGVGGGIFGKGVADGVSGIQDGENNLKTSISPDRRVLQRNVSSNSIRSDVVGTSDGLQLYARRGVGGGRVGVFGNRVEEVNGVQDGMGKLRPSNTNLKENIGNGTFLSNRLVKSFARSIIITT